jgi:hypothetical protein
MTTSTSSTATGVPVFWGVRFGPGVVSEEVAGLVAPGLGVALPGDGAGWQLASSTISRSGNATLNGAVTEDLNKTLTPKRERSSPLYL